MKKFLIVLFFFQLIMILQSRIYNKPLAHYLEQRTQDVPNGCPSTSISYLCPIICDVYFNNTFVAQLWTMTPKKKKKNIQGCYWQSIAQKET